VHIGQGQARQAARLLGAAHALHQSLGAPLTPVNSASYKQLLSQVRRGLGRTAFLLAWKEGQALTPDLAVAEVGYSGTHTVQC
jgi:hypothetical protein